MRQLHVLGVSDDGATLLLGATARSTKPTHRILLDERLRAAVRGQLARPGADRAESALTPKEIQARMRAGATPEEVAKAAGVSVARVLPYAVPVEAERQRIIDNARAAAMHRHRGPDASQPLGETADARLREVPGLKSESVEWTARRRHDGAWIVALSYAARGGRRSATWLWRPVERDLTSLDVAASRLASDGAPAKSGVRRKAAAARPATKRAAARKPASAKRAAGKPATVQKATVRKATVRKATAKKATVQKAAVRKAAATKPAAKAATKRSAAVAGKPARTARPTPAKAAVKKAAPAKAAPRRAAAVGRPVARKPVAAKPVAATPGARKPAASKLAASKLAAKKAAATRAAASRPAAVKRTAPPKPPVRRRRTGASQQSAPPTLRVVEPIEELVTHPAVEHVEEPAAVAQARGASARRRGQRVPLPSWSDVLLGVQATPKRPTDDSSQ